MRAYQIAEGTLFFAESVGTGKAGLYKKTSDGIELTKDGMIPEIVDSNTTWSAPGCPVEGFVKIVLSTPEPPAPPKQYRFLRILEYVGTREFIDRHIQNRGVKGSSPRLWDGEEGRITEAFVGELPTELLEGYLLQGSEAKEFENEIEINPTAQQSTPSPGDAPDWIHPKLRGLGEKK